ncbi:MAG: DUF1801 domain-containing protein [Acidobacteriota bacterium]|nr:DUF1801 domain-containing protein [Acidobacteriota bacterium]
MPEAIPKVTKDDVDQLLGSYDAVIKEIALSARDLISKLIPKAEEKVYFGWRIISFSLNAEMSGQFSSVGPGKKYVNLYFMQGTSLDDPKGLLEGTGKNMRHVKIREVSGLKNAALKELIKTAARHQQEKLQQTKPKQ